MRHRRARSLLASVLDRTLPTVVEAAVRAHADGCPRCARELRELRDCEELLLRLPLALVPREPSALADARLGALARWASGPVLAWQERLGLQAVGAFATAFLLVIAFSAGRWDPIVDNRFETSPISIAALPGAEVTPFTWR